MRVKVDFKRLFAVVLFLSLSCIVYMSLYSFYSHKDISVETTSTVVEDDGSFIVTKSYTDGFKIREEYDENGELSCLISTREEQGFSIAITERVDSEHVYKAVTDKETDETTVYRKSKDAPDSDYKILYSD